MNSPPWRWQLLVIAGQVQFVVISGLAMLIYGGGSAANPALGEYSYFGNFFSDLGRTVSISGAPNTAASLTFASTLVLLGLSHLVFYWHFRLSLGTRLFWTCRALGTVSATGVILTAFTPLDVARAAHKVAVTLWIVPFFAVTAIYCYYFLINGWRKPIVLLTAALSAVVLFHIAQLAFASTVWVAATQKLVVNFLLIWFSLCSAKHLLLEARAGGQFAATRV